MSTKDQPRRRRPVVPAPVKERTDTQSIQDLLAAHPLAPLVDAPVLPALPQTTTALPQMTAALPTASAAVQLPSASELDSARLLPQTSLPQACALPRASAPQTSFGFAKPRTAVIHQIVRRIVLIPAPQPPAPQRWWMPSWELEDTYQFGYFDGNHPVGGQIDFDHVVREMVKTNQAKGIENGETEGLLAGLYTTERELYRGYEGRATEADGWSMLHARFLLLRQAIAEQIEEVLIETLDSDEIMDIGNWAGLTETQAEELSVELLILAATGDKLRGLGAAAADYLAWHRPDLLLHCSGNIRQLASEMMRLIEGVVWADQRYNTGPLDNFVFSEGLHLDARTTDTVRGQEARVIRGKYVVASATYVSAADPSTWGRPVSGLPGWRHLELRKEDTPVHVCGGDCRFAVQQCGCDDKEMLYVWEPRLANVAGCCNEWCPSGEKPDEAQAADERQMAIWMDTAC